MKLSYDWLKQYVDINIKAEEIAEGLTMSGSEVGEIHSIPGDKIMELEITSNRPDCLNVIGLAREVSVIFNKNMHLPEMNIPGKKIHKTGPMAECIIENAELCPFYTARVISDVNVREVNEEIKKRILSVGMRGVNNVVDITNFCLIETGQPLHAFDLDKIEGHKIIVREAVKGEKIVTIDGMERELKPPMLVIADKKRPIAIAGIMGGRDTEVTESTRNILLESAYFSPVSVRQTARSLGLSSDSSYRFERGADIGMIKPASDRAALLISRETGGRICTFYKAGGFSSGKETKIKFNLERAERILGISLKKKEVISIFRKLGIKIRDEKNSVLITEIPTFREDLKNEIDLVEEIARIYGYNNIPTAIAEFIPAVTRKERPRKVIEKIYEILPALGLNEIMTYSLISETAAERFKDNEQKQNPVKLKNPLSEEQKVLTPQLLDGILRSISWNINRKNSDLGFFEIGKVYSEEKKFLETPVLAIGLTGLLRKNWQEGKRPVNLYDLKGMVEAVFNVLKVPVVFCTKESKGLQNCAGIRIPGEYAGFLGEVDAKVLADYDIEQKVFVCQIKLDRIIEKAVLEKHYHVVPRFPSSSRDISILCDRSITAKNICSVISETAEEIVRNIELIDVYEGKQIPAGKKSLTYGIEYGIDSRTLTEEEIEAVHLKIKENLTSKLDVTFR